MLRNRTPWNPLRKGVKGSTCRCRQVFQSRALKTPGDGTGCTYFCYGAALKAGSSTTLSSPSWLVECYLTSYEPHPSLPSSTACPRHLFYVPSCRYSDMEYYSRINNQCPCRCWSAYPHPYKALEARDGDRCGTLAVPAYIWFAPRLSAQLL